MNFAKPARLLLFLGAIGLLFSGCDLFEQRDRTFDDDPKVEFFPLSEVVDEGEGTVTTNVQLIGPQRDSDLQLNFTVDDSSTAVEGTHYELNSSSATISANSSSAPVSINVLDNSQDDGGTNYQLYLTLEGSSGVEPAENLKTYTLTIRGVDESGT